MPDTKTFAQWIEAEPGRNQATAAHFKRSKTAVSLWKRYGVPRAFMKAMREFTHGEVTLEEMVPVSKPLKPVPKRKKPKAQRRPHVDVESATA